MKISPATMLAAWAVGTAWLIVYVITEHCQDLELLEDEPASWIELAAVLLGVVLYRPIRKMFAEWLAKKSAS